MAKKKKFAANLVLQLIRLLASTWRFRGRMPDTQACIMFLWHEELFPVLKAASHQDWVAIISPSRDGDFLEKLVLPWGYTTLRGSANDQAFNLLRKTIKQAKKSHMMIGIDGPKGPRRKIKTGMMLAAQKAGVPIHLVRIRARGHRLENAWDKALLPYPLARCEILTSEPIFIDPALDRDALKALSLELNQRLDALGD